MADLVHPRLILILLALLVAALPGCVQNSTINSCTTTSGDCKLPCVKDQTISIQVSGSGQTSGLAKCGGVTVSCSEVGGCSKTSRERTGGAANGTCSLTSGTKIKCTAANY